MMNWKIWSKPDMFHPIPMRRMKIHLITEDIPAAALELATMDAFAPDEEPLEQQSELQDLSGDEYRQLYHAANMRFEKIISHLDMSLPYPELKPDNVITIEDLKKTNEWLTDVWAVCSECEEHIRELDEQWKLIRHLQSSLDKFSGLNLDLGQLQGKKTFLDLRIGMIPESNLSRLTQAVGLAGYVLQPYHRVKGNVNIVIAGAYGEQTEDLGSVLHAAGFHELQIPPEFHDQPEQVRKQLKQREAHIKQEWDEHERQKLERVNEYMDGLLSTWRTLKLAEPYVRLGNAVRFKGGLAVINGWVPAEQAEVIEEKLNNILPNPCYIETEKPEPQDHWKVPSAIRYPKPLRPFNRLVRNYGIPRYGEFDPTWLFTLTFILMYGMMFGDVGHGAVITLAAWVFRKRLMGFAPFIAIAGLSATAFGFLYGSVFGVEHWIHALWLEPLSNPMTLLSVALSLGFTLISISILVNIHNRVTEQDYATAFFAPNGAAGLWLFIGLVAFGYAWMQGDSPGYLVIFSLILPLMIMVAYEWEHSEVSPGEKPLVIAIEIFDIVVGMVSNLLSYLRVAAFALNHVALMIAVFTVAEMMDITGHWITLILGNLFIIVFEGAIVLIQVLRLEYYEGFSRYFRGDGRIFSPLTLRENVMHQYYG
jgi:V/A-type H+-transporting ATPase subunit I